jgi:hypothetical protein
MEYLEYVGKHTGIKCKWPYGKPELSCFGACSCLTYKISILGLDSCKANTPMIVGGRFTVALALHWALHLPETATINLFTTTCIKRQIVC